jgi:hypothetical protein
MKCLLCRKELEKEFQDEFDGVSSQPAGAGVATIGFHYGSKQDQLGVDMLGESPKKLLLASNEIRFYICDECFEENIDLFEGYNIERKFSEKRVV